MSVGLHAVGGEVGMLWVCSCSACGAPTVNDKEENR